MDGSLNEVKTNKFSIFNYKLFRSIAILFAVFQLYTGFFGIQIAMRQRSVHLLFALILIFLFFEVNGKKREKWNIKWYDYILIVCSIISVSYFAIYADELSSRWALVTNLSIPKIIVGAMVLLLVLEASRRVVGIAFTIIISVFLIYGLFGQYFPMPLGHKGFSISYLVDYLLFTNHSVWGTALNVSATFIYAFCLFASFLENTGAGQFFINASIAVAGNFRGGPAKTAVLASGLMGMVSGNSVANVATTGCFTIPLMKRVGYKPSFAGGVEACASTGGQYMPPIMGATAFLIAELTGIPYSRLILCAFIPAALYFFSVGMMVHFEAVKYDLPYIPKEELPSIKKVLKEGFYYIVPIVVLVWALMAGYSALRAGLYSTLLVIAIGLCKKEARAILFNGGFVDAIVSTAQVILQVAIACAAAGIIIGIVTLTGVGATLTGLVLGLFSESLILTLVLIMIVSIILGMGLPTIAAYVVQVAVTIPILVEFGVPILAAHMFVFYFSNVSQITPPVCLSAYAAAGIAQANNNETAFTAMRIGAAAYIIPFMFIYGPALLLQDSLVNIIIASISALLGVAMFASGLEGWLLTNSKVYERIILIIGSISLIFQGIYTDLIGIGCLIAVILLQQQRRSKITKNKGEEVLQG
ncbi:MAG: TRAP transporter permease [Dehalobacterium sp.]